MNNTNTERKGIPSIAYLYYICILPIYICSLEYKYNKEGILIDIYYHKDYGKWKKGCLQHFLYILTRCLTPNILFTSISATIDTCINI